MMQVLFEGPPIEIEFDDEISMTTESIQKYLAEDLPEPEIQDDPKPRKRKPPTVKVRVGPGRRTRSMTQEDIVGELPKRTRRTPLKKSRPVDEPVQIENSPAKEETPDVDGKTPEIEDKKPEIAKKV